MKFKHFVTKTIPSWVIRLGFALKRAIDKGINISQDIEIPSYVSEDTNVVSKESNEEIRDISDEAEILEDENTMDFSREKFDLEKDGAENMQSQFENPEEQQNSFRRAM